MFLIAQYAYDQNPRATHNDLPWAIECPEQYIARLATDPLLHPPIESQTESKVDDITKKTTPIMETNTGTISLTVTQEIPPIETAESQNDDPIPNEDE